MKNTINEIKKFESECLKKLKDKLKNLEDTSFCTSDKNLMKFLYARRLSASDAHTLILNRLKYKSENPELFENISINDPEIREALEASLPQLLPQVDRKCRTMIVFHANNWDGPITAKSIFKALHLCLDFALQNVHVQNNGFAIIVNWEQWTFRKSSCLNPITFRKMIYGFQMCYPAKFLEVHFIAAPFYISAIFSLFKLNFDEDLKDNFFMHGRNLSALHKFFHKDVLPTELGGTLPEYNCAELIEKLEHFCSLKENNSA